MKKGTGLKFVPEKRLSLIPRYLLEQVKNLSFDIDRFYALEPLIANSPLNFIGLFVDKDNTVKGFMWSTYNPLEDLLFVNVLSVDKEFQGGTILKEAIGICKKISKNIGASGKIKAKTNRPRAFEKIGFTIDSLSIVEMEA